MKITYKEYIKYAEPNIFDEVFEDKSFKQAAKAAQKAQELNEKRALKKHVKLLRPCIINIVMQEAHTHLMIVSITIPCVTQTRVKSPSRSKISSQISNKKLLIF